MIIRQEAIIAQGVISLDFMLLKIKENRETFDLCVQGGE